MALNVANLDNKTVAVTGAGRGIGSAVVLRLLQSGARVLALVQPDAPVTGLDGIQADHASRLDIIPADVTSTESIAAAVRRCRELGGAVDVLVNNAGIIQPIGKVADIDPGAWGRVLAVNATGAMRCTHAFLPLLIERRGTLINISSGAAYRPLEGWSAYCASKAALVMLARAVDLEYGDRGLKVFSLGVAPTDTAIQGDIRESGINELSRIPREKLSSPAQVAEVVAWLCGNDAAAITTLEIDMRDKIFEPLVRQWQ